MKRRGFYFYAFWLGAIHYLYYRYVHWFVAFLFGMGVDRETTNLGIKKISDSLSSSFFNAVSIMAHAGTTFAENHPTLSQFTLHYGIHIFNVAIILLTGWLLWGMATEIFGRANRTPPDHRGGLQPKEEDDN